MNYFKLMNSFEYISLQKICESHDEVFHMVIGGLGVISDFRSDNYEDREIELIQLAKRGREISIDIKFENYIGYSILDESYAIDNENETTNGRLFCEHKNSYYLDYISKASIASAEYPGPFNHYSFNCLNHIIDIASLDEPHFILLE